MRRRFSKGRSWQTASVIARLWSISAVAKQYAVASSADKETCLEALYGSVDANIHLTNFMAAYEDLITIKTL